MRLHPCAPETEWRHGRLQGEHAHRIWGAIYSQNCFRHVHSDACDEESLFFYRVISGVHASISMHLSRRYLLDEAANAWGPNMTEFRRRFAQPEKCSHVQNLYFAYLFVLKAVAKAAPALRAVHYVTGKSAEDARTKVRRRFVGGVALGSRQRNTMCRPRGMPFAAVGWALETTPNNRVRAAAGAHGRHPLGRGAAGGVRAAL